jgi:N6-adenosine-specific RNA methylase IME4
MYKTLLMDFPWRYKSPGWLGGAKRHYPTLPPAAAYVMPISQILCPKEGHLWFWTTDTFLEESFKIIRHWGYTVRATFNWVKLTKKPLAYKASNQYSERRQKDGIGFWSPVNYDGNEHGVAWGNGFFARSDCEYLLFAMPEKATLPMSHTARQTHKTFFAPLSEHSAKPEESYQLIRRYSPESRLELFARQHMEGFDLWGNELVTHTPIPCLDDWGRWAAATYP